MPMLLKRTPMYCGYSTMGAVTGCGGVTHAPDESHELPPPHRAPVGACWHTHSPFKHKELSQLPQPETPGQAATDLVESNMHAANTATPRKQCDIVSPPAPMDPPR
jgi:hypothetical protein